MIQVSQRSKLYNRLPDSDIPIPPGVPVGGDGGGDGEEVAGGGSCGCLLFLAIFAFLLLCRVLRLGYEILTGTS